MKKTLISLAFMFVAQLTVAQNYFNLTPNGFVNANVPDQTYIVINYEGKNKETLYTDFLSKITSVYVSAKSVVSKVDNNIISINGFSAKAVNLKQGRNPVVRYDMNYIITFEFKDGKVRINAPDILEMSTGKSNLTIAGETSFWFSQLAIFKKGELKEPTAKESLEKFFNDLISDVVMIDNSDW